MAGDAAADSTPPWLPLGELPYPVAQDEASLRKRRSLASAETHGVGKPTETAASQATQPRMVHVAAGAVLLVGMYVLVRAWDAWLVDTHKHMRLYPLKSDPLKFSEFESTRPQSLSNLACGFVPCLLFLGVCDLLIRNVVEQDSTRWFLLHVLANVVVSLSSAPDMFACLAYPLNASLGPISVLPVYMIATLFAYHLSAFHVPRDEWVHHLLFGGGIGGAGLYFAPGPLQNALAFFICGLPGGIDYAMLAMVKEGWISSATEKVANARINVWLRSPGLLMTSYAIYICEQAITVTIAQPWVMLMVVGLATLNGQYYMQRVVANTSHKVNGRGGC